MYLYMYIVFGDFWPIVQYCVKLYCDESYSQIMYIANRENGHIHSIHSLIAGWVG